MLIKIYRYEMETIELVLCNNQLHMHNLFTSGWTFFGYYYYGI